MAKKTVFVKAHTREITLSEGAKALSDYKKSTRGAGRPKTRNSGVTVGEIRQHIEFMNKKKK